MNPAAAHAHLQIFQRATTLGDIVYTLNRAVLSDQDLLQFRITQNREAVGRDLLGKKRLFGLCTYRPNGQHVNGPTILIPLECCVFSQGLLSCSCLELLADQEWNMGANNIPVMWVCWRFLQDGACVAGEKCRNVHIHRDQAKKFFHSSCCVSGWNAGCDHNCPYAHNDAERASGEYASVPPYVFVAYAQALLLPSQQMHTTAVTKHIPVSGVPRHISRIPVTLGLINYIRSVVTIPIRCEGFPQCAMGIMCRFFHVTENFVRPELPQPQPQAHPQWPIAQPLPQAQPQPQAQPLPQAQPQPQAQPLPQAQPQPQVQPHEQPIDLEDLTILRELIISLAGGVGRFIPKTDVGQALLKSGNEKFKSKAGRQALYAAASDFLLHTDVGRPEEKVAVAENGILPEEMLNLVVEPVGVGLKVEEGVKALYESLRADPDGRVARAQLELCLAAWDEQQRKDIFHRALDGLAFEAMDIESGDWYVFMRSEAPSSMDINEEAVVPLALLPDEATANVPPPPPHRLENQGYRDLLLRPMKGTRVQLDDDEKIDPALWQKLRWKEIPFLQAEWMGEETKPSFSFIGDEPGHRTILLPSCRLGDGATSDVRLGFLEKTGIPVAVKIFNDVQCQLMQQQVTSDLFPHEIERLLSRRHLHGLVQYVCHHETEIPKTRLRPRSIQYYLVTELLNYQLVDAVNFWRDHDSTCTTTTDGGSAQQPIVGSVQHIEAIQEVVRKLIGTALSFIEMPDTEGQSMIHRDVNLRNVMFDRYGHAKLIDIGLSRALRIAQTKVFGTSSRLPDNGFYPPEFFDACQGGHENMFRYGVCSDIYSIGRVALAMALANASPVGVTADALLHSAFSDRAPHSAFCLRHLVRLMTEKDLEKRSLQARHEIIVLHPFFWSAQRSIHFLANIASILQDTDRSVPPPMKDELYKALVRERQIERGGFFRCFGDSAGYFRTRFTNLHGPYNDSSYRNLLTLIRDHAPGHHSPFVCGNDAAAVLRAFPFLVMTCWDWANKYRLTTHVNINVFCCPGQK